MKRNLQKIIMFVVTGLLLTTTVVSANFTAYNKNGEYSPYTFELSPDGSARDSIMVENLSDDATTLNIYGADAGQSSTGYFALGTQNEKQLTVGKWLSFDESQVTLEPHEKKEVFFNVKVPENTTPGSYAGGIAAESIAKKAEVASGPALSVTSRFITQIFVEIPGQKNHAPQWTDFSYHVDPKDIQRFDFSFKNVGNTTVIAESKLEIFGYPDGNSMEEPTVSDEETKAALLLKRNKNIVKLNDINLYQNDTITVSSSWNKKPLFGNYTARGTVTFYEYDAKSGKKINPVTLTREIPFWVIRWDIMIWILAALAAITSALVYKSFMLKSMKKNSNKYQIQAGDTLESIAKKAGINWKLLGKMNKLKPPYTLEKGQTILVPVKNNNNK